MSRNIVRHLRFSKSEYEAISRKAAYLKIPEGRFIRRIAIQGNLKRYDLYELRKITRAFNYCGDFLEQIAALLSQLVESDNVKQNEHAAVSVATPVEMLTITKYPHHTNDTESYKKIG